MKAKYYEADTSVIELGRKIQNVFFDRFCHIKPNDIYYVFKDAAKNSFKAKTNITNGLYRSLTNKKIIIQIHKQEWELLKETDRALLIYRELYRIDKNQNDPSEYKLTREDVKDFKKILEKVGLHNETAESFLSKVVNPVAAK